MLKFELENNTNCIYADPEVETLLVTRGTRTGVMKKVLNSLMEGLNRGPCSLLLNIPSICPVFTRFEAVSDQLNSASRI
jgi:hypothetical protein